MMQRFTNLYQGLKGRAYRGKYAVIFMYHGVAETADATSNHFGKHVSAGHFKDQLKYISENYKIIPLDDLIAKLGRNHLDENCAAITFDDGYLNNFTVAYPILKTMGIPATVYLTTGFIGAERWFWADLVEHCILNSKVKVLTLPSMSASFNMGGMPERVSAVVEIKKRLKQLDEAALSRAIDDIRSGCCVDVEKPFGNYRTMQWDEVFEMSRNNITFGAHTVNHTILSRYSFEKAKREIIESKKTIQDRISNEVTSFCFPNGKTGDYTDEIKNYLAGNFECALSANSGRIVPGRHDLFELKRVGVSNDTSCPHLSRMLGRLQY